MITFLVAAAWGGRVSASGTAAVERTVSASESNYGSQNVGVFELVGIWIEIGLRFGFGFWVRVC